MTTALDDVLDAISQCVENEKASDDLTARVADLVLAYVGPPSADGVNDGSEAKLKQLAVAVEQKFATTRFEFPYLRRLRATAFKFPPEKRFSGVKFSLMLVACDPETLRGAMAQAEKDNRKCSASYIRKFRKFRQHQNKASDDAFVRLRETERRLLQDARFYMKITTCASSAREWSVEDRNALASAGRDLIRAVHQFVSAIEPMPACEAA
jgi:hypothetical protein